MTMETFGPTTTFAPSGGHHTLANLSRHLLVCTPGGFERRFDPGPRKPCPETILVGPPIGEES